MPPQVVVRPDKNVFLLYTWLTALHLDRITQYKGRVGDPLREKTATHFQSYSNPGLNTSNFTNISYAYILTLNDAPDFSQKLGITLDSDIEAKVKKTEAILPHLKHFYKNTDFEDFYQSILPGYQAECDALQTLVDRVNLVNILDTAWEDHFEFSMEIIPMPLEGMENGWEQRIGDKTFQIIGPSFDKEALYLIARVGSYPRARSVLKPISNEIRQRCILEEIFGVSFWPEIFVNLFSTALQIACINPILRGLHPQPWERNFTAKNALKGNNWWKKTLQDFYDQIKRYKDTHSKRNLAEVGLAILERLDKKYKIKINT